MDRQMDGQTDNGQEVITIAHPGPLAQVSLEVGMAGGMGVGNRKY